MTNYSIRKKEGSFFLETFCGVVVLLLSLLDAVTSEAWLNDRACQLKRTNPKGKRQKSGLQEQGLSAPPYLLFPVSNHGRQQALCEGEQETGQTYNNAGQIITLSASCNLHFQDVLRGGLCLCFSIPNSPEGTFLPLFCLITS